MLDLLIKGGQVVTPSGAGDFDVGIEDGRIVLVAERNAIELEAH